MNTLLLKLKLVFSLLLLSILAFQFTSCGETASNCTEIPSLFNGKNVTSEILDEYTKHTSSNNRVDSVLNEEVRFYVDKSSGIHEAFSSATGGETSKKQLQEIINNYRESKFLGVLREITPFDLGGADPTNYFTDSKNYEKVDGQSADLLNALTNMTNHNGLSFFVTDGEQFDATKTEITAGAWAVEPLKKWIEGGNTIHFWITDFKAKNIKKQEIIKHLFFIAFVPAEISGTKKFQDLLKSLNVINPTHLELSNVSWKINKPDWAEQESGLDPNMLKEGVFEKEQYKRNFENTGNGYEFLSIQLPIKAEVLTVDGALSKPQFYRDLFVDLSNNKFFDITKLEIDVFDVTRDINAFASYFEILGNKPATAKDPNNQATIIDPNSTYGCYYELKNDQPIIKPENVYTSNFKDYQLKEFFQFDEEVFNNSLKDNPNEVEIAIRFHKNFNENDPSLNNELGYNILRVDFKIEEFNDKTVTELSNFSWASMWKSSEQNTGFSKSVEQVIKATQPKGRVIHSLFIKFIKA
jgi:hypothetical protein